jgi:hypothetical protein
METISEIAAAPLIENGTDVTTQIHDGHGASSEVSGPAENPDMFFSKNGRREALMPSPC